MSKQSWKALWSNYRRFRSWDGAELALQAVAVRFPLGADILRRLA